MAHKEVIGIFLNIDSTIRSSVDIIKLCETDIDDVGPLFPYSLCVGWRSIVAKRIIVKILSDYPLKTALEALLVTKDDFIILHCDSNSLDDNCTRQSIWYHLLTMSIANNMTSCVTVCLYKPAIPDLKLVPRS
jgi:hypothetical protein